MFCAGSGLQGASPLQETLQCISVTLQVAGAFVGLSCEFRSTEKANAKILAGARSVFCQCKSIK